MDVNHRRRPLARARSCAAILGRLLALQAVLAIAAAAAQAGDACCCGLRAQDQLWVVSDRALGCNTGCTPPRLQYWRYDCQQRWTRSDLDQLRALEDPLTQTVVFIHGNRLTSSEAFARAWTCYRTLVRCADEQPVRFIAWSWPSDKMGGPFQDARIKAARTNVTAYYLAWFLDQLAPEAPISLWAHSFGARAATGALHLLGGGELCGRVLDRAHPDRAPAQAVLLAAALDNNWLMPGHFHGQALSATSEMLLVNNSCDRLLAQYHWLYHRRSNRQALGYTGIGRRYLGPEGSKVMQIDACCQVGKQHTFMLYIQSASLMSRIRQALLTAPVETILTGPELAALDAVEMDPAETDTVPPQ